jgi:hypothetical protein
MKQQFFKAIIGASLASCSFVLQAQVAHVTEVVNGLSFANQSNTGNQTTTLTLNNIQVTSSKLNLSAIGNVMGVSASKDVIDLGTQANLNTAAQMNSGNQLVQIMATGAKTDLSKNDINGTAIGNVQSYEITNTSKLASGIQSAYTQSNSGNQSAAFIWAEDPTTRLNLNLSAIGNVQNFSIK